MTSNFFRFFKILDHGRRFTGSEISKPEVAFKTSRNILGIRQDVKLESRPETRPEVDFIVETMPNI